MRLPAGLPAKSVPSNGNSTVKRRRNWSEKKKSNRQHDHTLQHANLRISFQNTPATHVHAKTENATRRKKNADLDLQTYAFS
jgi:hypothetical protein